MKRQERRIFLNAENDIEYSSTVYDQYIKNISEIEKELVDLRVTCSHHLRGGGFSLNSPIGLSINELSPCVPRF